MMELTKAHESDLNHASKILPVWERVISDDKPPLTDFSLDIGHFSCDCDQVSMSQQKRYTTLLLQNLSHTHSPTLGMVICKADQHYTNAGPYHQINHLTTSSNPWRVRSDHWYLDVDLSEDSSAQLFQWFARQIKIGDEPTIHQHQKVDLRDFFELNEYSSSEVRVYFWHHQLKGFYVNLDYAWEAINTGLDPHMVHGTITATPYAQQMWNIINNIGNANLDLRKWGDSGKDETPNEPTINSGGTEAPSSGTWDYLITQSINNPTTYSINTDDFTISPTISTA